MLHHGTPFPLTMAQDGVEQADGQKDGSEPVGPLVSEVHFLLSLLHPLLVCIELLGCRWDGAGCPALVLQLQVLTSMRRGRGGGALWPVWFPAIASTRCCGPRTTAGPEATYTAAYKGRIICVKKSQYRSPHHYYNTY